MVQLYEMDIPIINLDDDASSDSIVEVATPLKPPPPLIHVDCDETVEISIENNIIINVQEEPIFKVPAVPEARSSLSRVDDEISPYHWTEDMRTYYNDDRDGEENFNVYDLQRMMSTDKRLWTVGRTPYPRLGKKGRHCFSCGQLGHMDGDCKPISCHMCGEKGHTFKRCPRSKCLSCGKKTHKFVDVCNSCINKRRRSKCSRCRMAGHSLVDCPDHWRRFHNIIEANSVPEETPLPLTDYGNIWCCNCGKKGHLDAQCQKHNKSPFALTSTIVSSYERSFAVDRADNGTPTTNKVIDQNKSNASNAEKLLNALNNNNIRPSPKSPSNGEHSSSNQSKRPWRYFGEIDSNSSPGQPSSGSSQQEVAFFIDRSGDQTSQENNANGLVIGARSGSVSDPPNNVSLIHQSTQPRTTEQRPRAARRRPKRDRKTNNPKDFNNLDNRTLDRRADEPNLGFPDLRYVNVHVSPPPSSNLDGPSPKRLKFRNRNFANHSARRSKNEILDNRGFSEMPPTRFPDRQPKRTYPPIREVDRSPARHSNFRGAIAKRRKINNRNGQVDQLQPDTNNSLNTSIESNSKKRKRQQFFRNLRKKQQNKNKTIDVEKPRNGPTLFSQLRRYEDYRARGIDIPQSIANYFERTAAK